MKETVGITSSIVGFIALSVLCVWHKGLQRTVRSSPDSSPTPGVQEPFSSAPAVVPHTQPSSSLPPDTHTEQAPSWLRGEPLLPQKIAPLSSAPPPTVEAPVRPLTATTPSHQALVTFPVGCAVLTGDSRATLDTVLAVLQQQPEARIEIIGYTDNTGHEQYNLDLSRLRADVIRYYLMAQGVDDTRITTYGRGTSTPIADNTTAAGRQQNRRSEITFYTATPSPN
ncbi:MAG: OmpA family protein [Candidatus Binatia bacterium]